MTGTQIEALKIAGVIAFVMLVLFACGGNSDRKCIRKEPDGMVCAMHTPKGICTLYRPLMKCVEWELLPAEDSGP